MKLLMISGDRSLAQGKKGAFYNTLEELRRHFERVVIICPPIGNSKLKIVNYFDNVEVHPSPWPLVFQPLWILREGSRIIRVENSKLPAFGQAGARPEKIENWFMTVHEYPPFYNGIGARLLWQKIKVPYLLEVFHVPGYPRSANLKEILYKKLTGAFIGYDTAKTSAVRVMNEDMGDFLEKAGVPRKKIKLIPAIYIDFDVFRPVNLIKEYDLIFIGRLESNKGVDLLLKAIEFSIFNLKFSIKCLIVGEGLLKEELKLKIKNLKLQDNVLLHGFAKDSREISELMNKSKILVMPSYNEGGPRVVVEALACGVPVLASRVGIVPNLLKNGLGCEIIDWKAEDIAKKAQALLGDPVRYGEFSKNGPKIAAQFERRAAIRNYAEELHKIGQNRTN
ncbi:MAG: hypothetical protein A3B99_04390 [Candidatus Yanofskybacteria bacterium RIFCSPHIGHO2_02_FULL_44_12b]|nr:MAG: hypothetical protein A2659_00450 [Candidatus Yanofskybacteria bacterium RIFCSPHIGHO2_01_FULL_44_24]OGN15752.1 MAG: hypothetical protein A3B99_04390 [Candidatus Yanofskybacteria bacterium RIFCSPHIGHO2_02_FULL_44_12b]OGN25653.1 MAG: hypothetical protein A2925_01865 [Candidatus Yanofskybacteria bacterium RIFCSPLOWO2_01_FULL_44_22]